MIEEGKESHNRLLESDSDHEDSEQDQKKIKRKSTRRIMKELSKKQKTFDIRAIEFNWIFNHGEGAMFFRTLASSHNVDLFSLTIIKYIITFFWEYYRFAIVLYLFLPFLVYFITFVLYCTYFHKKMTERDDGMFEGFGIPNFVSIIIILISILYNCYYEVLQIISNKWKYFVVFWNIIDLISIGLNTAIVICDLVGVNETRVTTLMGIGVLLMWAKLFYFGRIFMTTASMVKMVIAISYDMRYFLLIFILSLLGFTNTFYIVARNTSDPFTGDTIARAFIYTVNQVNGNFDTDSYSDEDRHLLTIFWFLTILISLIVFLNLLIAIMGDTFDKVKETEENSMLQELASLMVENEFLLDRKKTFGNAKYIFVITEAKAIQAEVNWDGRLNRLRDFMFKKVDEQSNLLKSMQTNISHMVKDKTERRVRELDNSTSKYFNSLFGKYDELENLVNQVVAMASPEEDQKDENDDQVQSLVSQ